MGLVTSVRGMYNKWVIAERVHLLVNVGYMENGATPRGIFFPESYLVCPLI
jgi:hypothetical protein